MKLNKLKTYRNKILKLKLIQTKIYKKNYNNFIKIEDICIRIKKALQIIYNYHVNNKRILFVGTPMHITLASKFKKLLSNTPHTFLPEYIWMSGLLTNQKACFRYLSKNSNSIENKTSKILFQLNKKSDLVVILDFFSNQEAITEAYLARIPVISLNCDLHFLNNNSNYKIPGNFKFTKKKIRDMFFFSILAATFKKAQKNSITKNKNVK